jgi:hypothetical protein
MRHILFLTLVAMLSCAAAVGGMRRIDPPGVTPETHAAALAQQQAAAALQAELKALSDWQDLESRGAPKAERDAAKAAWQAAREARKTKDAAAKAKEPKPK